ncbi:MAG: IS3 family transposase [Treponema sp.]|nr:IS3 family transposase [Treponema sp.]
MEEKFVIDSRLRLLSELFFEYIEIFYNTKRIHSHCGFISPNEYEAQFKYKNSAMRYKKAD